MPRAHPCRRVWPCWGISGAPGPGSPGPRRAASLALPGAGAPPERARAPGAWLGLPAEVRQMVRGRPRWPGHPQVPDSGARAPDLGPRVPPGAAGGVRGGGQTASIRRCGPKPQACAGHISRAQTGLCRQGTPPNCCRHGDSGSGLHGLIVFQLPHASTEKAKHLAVIFL